MSQDEQKAPIYYEWKPLKERPVDQRPREKMEKYGSASLTDAELLGVLISAGYRGRTAVELAQDLLEEWGGLRGMREISLEILKQKKGLGLSRATRIVAAMELSARILQEEGRHHIWKMNYAEAVHRYLAPRIGQLRNEEFYVLLLNSKLELLKEVMVSRGGFTQTMAEPGTAYREALRYGAPAVIFAHNHPSGDTTPSREDELLTKKLKEAGDLLKIQMLDHIIVGNSGYYSFAEKGKL